MVIFWGALCTRRSLRAMQILTSRQARGNFSEILNQVSYGRERVAVQRPGKAPVYLISAADYERVRHILEKAEEQPEATAC